MILYHGSPHSYDVIRKSQAQADDGLQVPEKELQDAIYLTPSYEFAVLNAAMPENCITNTDDENMTVQFEKPELFKPEKEVYIYEVDSETIPSKNMDKFDELQIAVLNTEEIKPTAKKTIKAAENVEVQE